jgi:hypothetical protein
MIERERRATSTNDRDKMVIERDRIKRDHFESREIISNQERESFRIERENHFESREIILNQERSFRIKR